MLGILKICIKMQWCILFFPYNIQGSLVTKYDGDFTKNMFLLISQMKLI